MKIFFVITTLLTTLFTVAPVEVNAGVSIQIGDPAFYGRIDVGNYPPPRLIYDQPVIVRRVETWYPPIYLRVPPSHIKNWYRHCDQYGACGRPVYFIDDGWYRDVYVPRYREHYRRTYVPGGPRVIYKPEYYEYRKYDRKPPKRIYIREERYNEDDRRRRDGDRHHRDDDRRGRDHQRR